MRSLLSISLLLALFTQCKEEEMSYNYQFRTISTVRPTTADNIFVPIPQAKVYLYASEEDYLLRQNVLEELVTDEEGYVTIPSSAEQPKYWIYAEKANLNNLRYGLINSSRGTDAETYTLYYDEIQLSTTPTKLQITVLEDGQPTEASVELYVSEESYEQDISFNDEFEEDTHETYTHLGTNFLEKWSDSNGVVLFDNLEPRKYWFRVIATQSKKNNSMTTYFLEEPLEDNPDITTSITIGVQ